MNIVQILRDAIERLPVGDHSPGLNAILRHISIAIRHFDRKNDDDSDSFTDAIYRTNQAYEGSLKEAYRVLAQKDPSRKTPNEIEKYLEDNNIIRPRVLTQLSRYRSDYRNPSAHDYKLDFDEDEALLAIVSVCAFAKLLVDQISERVAFEAAQQRTQATSPLPVIDSDESFESTIVSAAFTFTRTADPDSRYSEFDGALAGVLTGLGFKTAFDKKPTYLPEVTWDIFVKKDERSLPIEIRNVSAMLDLDENHALGFTISACEEDNISAGLVIMRSSSNNDYRVYKYETDNHRLYIISRYAIEDIGNIKSFMRGKLKTVDFT